MSKIGSIGCTVVILAYDPAGYHRSVKRRARYYPHDGRYRFKWLGTDSQATTGARNGIGMPLIDELSIRGWSG